MKLLLGVQYCVLKVKIRMKIWSNIKTWSLDMVGNASTWRDKIRELTENLVMTFKYMRDTQNNVND